MGNQSAAFQVGDQVIHWMYGLGRIVKFEEKALSGQKERYFVVEIPGLTLWVPQKTITDGSLRAPTPAHTFQERIRILSSRGEPLSPDRYIRKNQLADMLKERTLESICRIIRDLADYKRTKKINENDNSVLIHARNLLLNEWCLVLSVTEQQAENDMKAMLEL